MFRKRKETSLVATGWQGVSLEHLRRIQGKDISMVFENGIQRGKIKAPSEWALNLDGFSFYFAEENCVISTGNIYSFDLENKSHMKSSTRIFKNSKGEYTLRTCDGWGVGFSYDYNGEHDGFMKQKELDFGYVS